ncbi:hypothetical protein FRC11_004324, partial [Ceratobasidium sp. 423]
MPTPEETRYPSQSCEKWAKLIFDLLDKAVTFRPTCFITDKLIPAQEIGFWPEYGELHIAFTQLINRSIAKQSEHDSLFPIPEWPASDCLFHAQAFEVAAVSFRDQMERWVQKLYDLLTIKSANLSTFLATSTKKLSNIDLVQMDLCDQANHSYSDSSSISSNKSITRTSEPPFVPSKEHKMTLLHPRQSSEVSSNRNSIRFFRKPNNITSPVVTTEPDVKDMPKLNPEWEAIGPPSQTWISKLMFEDINSPSLFLGETINTRPTISTSTPTAHTFNLRQPTQLPQEVTTVETTIMPNRESLTLATRSGALNAKATHFDTPGSLPEVTRYLERLKEQCENTSSAHTPEAIVPSAHTNQTHELERLLTLGLTAMDLLMVEPTLRAPRPHTPRPHASLWPPVSSEMSTTQLHVSRDFVDCLTRADQPTEHVHISSNPSSNSSLVPTVSTGETETWVQEPSEHQEHPGHSQNRETPATSPGSLCNSSLLQDRVHAELTTERLAELLARPAPVPSLSTRMREEFVNSKNQERMSKRSPPEAVSVRRQDSLCTGTPTGLADTPAVTTRTVTRPLYEDTSSVHLATRNTHSVRDPSVESAPDKPRTDTQQPANIQTSITSDVSPSTRMNMCSMDPVTRDMHITHTSPAESASDTLRTDTQQFTNLQTSTTGEISPSTHEDMRSTHMVTRNTYTTCNPTVASTTKVQMNEILQDTPLLTLNGSPHSHLDESLLQIQSLAESTLEQLAGTIPDSSHCVSYSGNFITHANDHAIDQLSTLLPTTEEQEPSCTATPSSADDCVTSVTREATRILHVPVTKIGSMTQKEDECDTGRSTAHDLLLICVSSSPTDSLAPTIIAATHTTRALVAESIHNPFSVEIQQLTSPQALTASSHPFPANSPLRNELLTEPTLTRHVYEPNLVPNINVNGLKEVNYHSNGCIIDRLSTPSTIAAGDQEPPHTVAPPSTTDLVTMVASAATRTIRVPIAKPSSRRPTEIRQTHLGELRRSQGTAGPADHSVRPEAVGGEEEEPTRDRPPTVEWRRSRASEHSRHRSHALPQGEPNISRQTDSIVPPRSHTGARLVNTTRLNENNLPPHIRSRIIKSRRISELLQDDRPREHLRERLAPIREGDGDDPYDDDYYYSSDDNSNWNYDPPGGPPDEPGDNPDREPAADAARVQPFRAAPVHFGMKLKPDIIPEWNGDTKELSKWIISINNMAEYSDYTRIQLGQQVPLRLTDRALRWFKALDKAYRRQITADWPSLRRAITIHFMNRTFMEHNKADALYMRFRDKYHTHESPEDYVICKMEALTILSDWTDSELIAEIMNSAPDHWALYIDRSVVNTWDDFLDKIAWHEEKLSQNNEYASSDIQKQLDEMKAILSNLEIDQNQDFETDRSHQETDKDIIDDENTLDNESETDEELPEQDSTKTLRSFAASVSAYTPTDSDETQWKLEGNIFNRNPDLTCEIKRPAVEQSNPSINNIFSKWTGDKITRIQLKLQSPASKRLIAEDFDSEIAFINKSSFQELEQPLSVSVRQSEANSDKKGLSQCATSTSKQRDVVPGGNTWDIGNHREIFIPADQSIALLGKSLEEALGELRMHLGGSKLATLTKHDALDQNASSIHNRTTWDLLFPTKPGRIRLGIAKDDRSIWILKEFFSTHIIGALKLTNPAPKFLLSKFLSTDQLIRAPQCIHRHMHDIYKIYANFTSYLLAAAQSYQYGYDNMDTIFVVFNLDDLLHANPNVYRALKSEI